MTIRAVGFGVVPRELSLVKILVAAAALAVFQPGRQASLVAGTAVYTGMFSFQGKPGIHMVEAGYPLYLPERLLRMTLLTILSKPGLMHILVAG